MTKTIFIYPEIILQKLRDLMHRSRIANLLMYVQAISCIYSFHKKKRCVTKFLYSEFYREMFFRS